MFDYQDLNKTIKRAAIEAVAAGKPVHIVFGKVTNVNPLKILIDQKLTLGTAQIILTRNVTNFTRQEIVDERTESHSIQNALKINDSVLLLRMQGGQKYIVIDRLG